MFYDFEYPPKGRSLFGQVQAILFGDKTVKSIIRPIPNRFLQLNTVAQSFVELCDASIWDYYSSFLTVQEHRQYASKVKTVLDRLKVPEEKRPQLWNTLDQQRKQAKTDANNDRKARIPSALFLNQEKIDLLLID